VGDVIVGRLCGRRAHDPTSLSIALLYNPWLKRSDPEILSILGVEDNQLPCLMPATTAAGVLGRTTARAVGLRAGIPVSPAVHDQYAASLGAAAIAEGDVNFGAGTAWVLLANAANLSPPATPEAFVCPHPVAGLFGQMLSLTNGGSAIHWAMNLLGNQCAKSTAVDRMLKAAPPGAEGLRFWPFLSNGPQVNGMGRLKGRLSGITLVHQPSHLIRAVVEGLSCELRRHLECLAGSGIRIQRLIMCGGATSGHETPRIIADVTRLPVRCVKNPNISALGGAMLARSLVEPDVQLDAIARQWAPPRRMVSPRKPPQAYRDLYQEYLSIFTEHRPERSPAPVMPCRS
jgi:xylulokinase